MSTETLRTHGRADDGIPQNATAPRAYRVAYLVTHPIQYQAPLLRRLSAEPDVALTVYFQSDLTVRPFHDKGFGRSFQWDVPLVEGYRHEFLPTLGPRATVESALWPLNYGIASRLWRNRFDILWVHGYERWFNWVAILAAKAVGTAVVVRSESTAISVRRSSAKRKAKRLFFSLLNRCCDGFLAIGTLNRQYYLANGIPSERIFSVPYCVDNAFFAGMARAAAPRRDTLRHALGLASQRPLILFASKFLPRKRAGDLLGAFAKLVATAEAARRPYLLFVGDGEERGLIETKAAPLGDDVRFLGFLNQSQLPAYYDLCDVFVLPSEREPWGLVVNEVMNAGRAVIVSDQVGCGPDLVRNGVNGYVYPCGDVDALAAALGEVLRDAATAAAMGRESAKIIAAWDFESDVRGLRGAFAAAVRGDGAGEGWPRALL